MWMSIPLGVMLAALVVSPADSSRASRPGGPGPAVQTSPVDLVQTQLSLPGKIKIGKNFRIMDELENVGESTAAMSVTYYYLSEDDKLDPKDVPFAGRRVPALPPGRSHSAVSAATLKEGLAKPGVYYVIAMADAERVVEERYEENNTRAVKVTIEPAEPPKK